MQTRCASPRTLVPASKRNSCASRPARIRRARRWEYHGGVTLEGRTVGRYQILRTLAEGGMGRVLLARTDGPAGFTKQVVLKTLHAHLAQDQAFLDVFLVEARVSAALNHPNVAQVFELVADGGEYFLAMEYVRGRSLRELLSARGALEPSVAMTVASQLGRALQHAHEARDERGQPLHLLHRDVSPENVLLSWDGAVKLLDFGLSGLRGRRAGKPGYVAPEVLDGASPTAASDQYALGVLLAEALTGAPPAGHARTDGVHADAAALPRRGLEGGLAAAGDLEALLRRALAVAPDARFPSAGALADALDAAIRLRGDFTTPATLAALLRDTFGPPDEAAPAPAPRTALLTDVGPAAPAPRDGAPTAAPKPPRARKRALAALGLAAVAAAGVLGASASGPPAPRAPGPAAARPPPRAETDSAAPRPPLAPATPDASPEAAGAGAAAAPGAAVAAAATPPTRASPPEGGAEAGAAARQRRAGQGPPAVRDGTLELRVIPWARVTIDGRAYGVTPLAPVALAPGQHAVRLENSELGVDTTRQVTVRSGAKQRLRVDLLDALGADE